MIALLLICAPLASAYQMNVGVTPVQKVLHMMEEMLAKGKAEKQSEKEVFSEYIQWCKDTTREKGYAIRDAGAAVEKLTAAKGKADADVMALNDAIAQLDSDIATANADKKASTEVRDAQRADYDKLHADYSESISSMGEAIRTIGSQPSKMANSFAQFPAKTRGVIAALLEDNLGRPVSADQAGSAFESSSGGILDTLKDMKDKMSDEREKAENEESQQRNAYQLMQQDLTMSIESMSDEMDQKTERSAQRQQDSASDGADAQSQATMKAEDEKYLADVTATCEQKSSDFAERQALRQEELEAVQQAADIIGSGSVSGKADKHLPKLVQTSFVQLRSTTEARRSQVVEFLQNKGLAKAAAQAMEGPFDKVVGMIKSMIAKLTEEAGEEAEHKAWCDGELQANKQTRDSKTAEVSQLTAQKEQIESQLVRLGEEMEALSSAIAELNQQMQQATAQRNKEHAKNTEAVADAKEAQAAVSQALKVLKDFYAKAAAATALVQSHHRQPASFDSAYKGMGGSSTGVVGMLDVILSDFVRLEQETSSEESSAARAFAEFSEDSNADIKMKTDDMKDKGKKSAQKERDLSQTNKDLKATTEELNAAQDVFNTLKPACLDAGVDFEERTARREEEIQSLREALKLLN